MLRTLFYGLLVVVLAGVAFFRDLPVSPENIPSMADARALKMALTHYTKTLSRSPLEFPEKAPEKQGRSVLAGRKASLILSGWIAGPNDHGGISDRMEFKADGTFIRDVEVTVDGNRTAVSVSGKWKATGSVVALALDKGRSGLFPETGLILIAPSGEGYTVTWAKHLQIEYKGDK